MRLTFDRFNGRSQHAYLITDTETGKTVGSIFCPGNRKYGAGGMEASIFDGKYRSVLNGYAECVAFVKGVEVVLNEVAWLLKSEAGVASNVA
jgi:hypothetical protein